jgi:SAM-dependent methyltransferase
MAKFDPDFYQQFRPLYPTELYGELPAFLAQRGFTAPFQIADIGCGTGHSTLSLFRSGLELGLIGVDPDPAMLAKARELDGLKGQPAQFLLGSGEKTGLPDLSADVITVGSAFHWMDAQKAQKEFLRILKPRGLFLVYEYQFPKCAALPELNEWIRREFNLRWKAPLQTPRGDFEQVTQVFRASSRWRLLSDRRVPMMLRLSPEDLSGLIFSQSRVLHFEGEMTAQQRSEFHEGVKEQVSALMNQRSAEFDFNLNSASFGKEL